MKKLLFLLPFILFACDDAELVIPGENVGNPGVEVEEPTDYPILKKYVSNFPGFEYTLVFNDDRYLTQYNNHTIIRDENGKITRVSKDNEVYQFFYDDEMVSVDSIVQGDKIYKLAYTTKEDRLEHLSSATQHLVVGEKVEEVAEYTFDTNKLKFIKEYKIQYLDSLGKPLEGKNTVAKFNIKTIDNNLSVRAIAYQKNNNALINATFIENENPNPIVKLTRTDYNPLVLVEAFSEKMDDTAVPQLDLLALLIAEKNRSEITFNADTFILEYINRDDDYPTKADVKESQEGDAIGEVIYTYR